MCAADWFQLFLLGFEVYEILSFNFFLFYFRNFIFEVTIFCIDFDNLECVIYIVRKNTIVEMSCLIVEMHLYAPFSVEFVYYSWVLYSFFKSWPISQ